MSTPAHTTSPQVPAAAGHASQEIPQHSAEVLRSRTEWAGRVVFRRWLDRALAALVVLCLILSAFVWWRLLS
ncbi:MAG: hypothetical protein ACREJB_02200 [Planctomycetaceae bacterium]